MGNTGSEPASSADELPQHSVNLSGYSIGKYEVTRGQYRQFMNAGGYTNPAFWSSAGWAWKGTRTEPDYWAASQDWEYPYGDGSGWFTQTDDYPVVGITYYEAEAFCNLAGGHLPTEAQWEKAARWTGSYPNVYPWGDVWDAEKCNSRDDTNPAGGGKYAHCRPLLLAVTRLEQVLVVARIWRGMYGNGVKISIAALTILRLLQLVGMILKDLLAEALMFYEAADGWSQVTISDVVIATTQVHPTPTMPVGSV